MFKKSLVLAPGRQSDYKCCKTFTFPCPTLWRPEQVAYIGMSKLRSCQPTLFIFVRHAWSLLEKYNHAFERIVLGIFFWIDL